jgi:hypothetical protein
MCTHRPQTNTILTYARGKLVGIAERVLFLEDSCLEVKWKGPEEFGEWGTGKDGHACFKQIACNISVKNV